MTDKIKQSPFAPQSFVSMPMVPGIKLAAQACGIKYQNRADVMVVECVEGTVVSGTVTRSKTASANVLWTKDILPKGQGRLLVVNSGNANAFNGIAGEESVQRIITHCAALWQCEPDEIYSCATGVIGEPLPDEVITSNLESLKESLDENAWEKAAKAIMTTDTYAKGATRTVTIDNAPVVINGIAKGSGMIAPDMATLLSYVFTNAVIAKPILDQLVKQCVDQTFNSITVDSDTSTSDTFLAFATAQAEHKILDDIRDPRVAVFAQALKEVMLELAHHIVKDGEGASKFIAVTVTGAEDDVAAKVIALSVANSPLVKTAIAGEDANWGRIVMAVGKAGEDANRDKMSVAIGGIVIAKDGKLNPAYKEEDVTKHMQGEMIDIEVDVGVQMGKATVWTCDLTHDYISINADYRS